MNNKKCAVCSSQKLRKINYRNTWSDLFNDKSILVCDMCGFGRIDPKIDTATILDFYKNVYRSKESPHHVDFSKYIPSPAFYRTRSISQLLLGLQYIQHKEKYNFLDIGSGLGRSFISAREILQGDVSLYAIEQDKEAKKYYQQHIKGLTICDDITDLNDDMDIVLMSHSLEHFDIDDMQSLFSEVYNVLAENGIMIIEVPHADFRDKDYEKNRPKDVPHLSFLSLESLKLLVESLNFELCFIDTAGVLVEDMFFSQNIPHKKGIKWMLRKFLKKIRLHSLLAKLKYNFSLKIRSTLSRDVFYKDVNFQYKGNRAVLRCILRKKPNSS
jgi:SAM-dependent methyltransferase